VVGAEGTQQTVSFVVTVETPWDANSDGIVDIRDIVTVAAEFGRSVEEDSPADVNRDGIVDIVDLVLVARHFGESVGILAAPQLPAGARLSSLQTWRDEAIRVHNGTSQFQRGIQVLEALIAAVAPHQTALLPNFPNPFNPETWIPYELSGDSHVVLTIYDNSGRTVRRLDIGSRAAGAYRSRDRAAYWDGRNDFGEQAGSGIYYVELGTFGKPALRRLIVLR
jgi:hypothetical protein